MIYLEALPCPRCHSDFYSSFGGCHDCGFCAHVDCSSGVCRNCGELVATDPDEEPEPEEYETGNPVG